MRSVNLHLVGVTKSEVAAELSSIAQKGIGEHWYHPDRAHARLTIRFHPGSRPPEPPNTEDEFVGTLGAPPDVTIYCDTAGRLNPDEAGHQIETKEIHEFVDLVLRRFEGVARDDLSTHLWTLDEIRAGKHVEGAGFGDHDAWRRRHTRPTAH
jgi:hypothetical protein